MQKYYELEDQDGSSNACTGTCDSICDTDSTHSSSSSRCSTDASGERGETYSVAACGALAWTAVTSSVAAADASHLSATPAANRDCKAKELARLYSHEQQTAAAGSNTLPLHNNSNRNGATAAVTATDSNTAISYSNRHAAFELHLDFTVMPSELIAVVGSVATGKSALISAILNDMTRISGSVTVNGSIAYVAQTAFICNMTLRHNILFGAHYDQERYNAVLHACALTDDIALLPAGDLTEIGEKVSKASSSAYLLDMSSCIYRAVALNVKFNSVLLCYIQFIHVALIHQHLTHTDLHDAITFYDYAGH
jgi:hypothetical protein